MVRKNTNVVEKIRGVRKKNGFKEWIYCESANLRICESANLRICESANLRICESANLRNYMG